MKITIEKYNSNWPNLFNDCKTELTIHLKEFNPIIEHIGSTSIEGMAAKPFIDILVGVPTVKVLDPIADILSNKDYIYFEKYNPLWPTRRFFIKLKSKENHLLFPKIYSINEEVHSNLNEYKLAHFHIIEYNTSDWIRHIAFREYVRSHSIIAKTYQRLKEELSQRDWMNGMEYNEAKNEFIKKVEADAIEWYKSKQ